MTQATLPDAVDRNSLVAIATDVWATMLGLDLLPVDPGIDSHPDEHTIDGVVSITGSWCGAVVVRVSRPLAVRIAQTMFEVTDSEPSLADIQDAMGELTNTTGGNIKGLMPGFCQLSLPAVVDGRDFRLRVPGAVTAADLRFDCEGERVAVQLVAAGDVASRR